MSKVDRQTVCPIIFLSSHLPSSLSFPNVSGGLFTGQTCEIDPAGNVATRIKEKYKQEHWKEFESMNDDD